MNANKCQFGVSALVFMGHKLTREGIDPTEDKVDAVAEAQGLWNVSEVRSFLGVVNYCVGSFQTLLPQQIHCES